MDLRGVSKREAAGGENAGRLSNNLTAALSCRKQYADKLPFDKARRFSWQRARAFLRISHQRHKAEIHVKLHMAVKQREPWIIRNKIDFSTLAAWNVDRILADS
jgi:hypothetical protein